MLPAPWLLALALALGLIVLIPARRLQVAGFSRIAIGTYAASLWALGMFVAVRPIGIRFLLPILLIVVLLFFFALTVNPLYGLGVLVLIGVGLYVFGKWEQKRETQGPPSNDSL